MENRRGGYPGDVRDCRRRKHSQSGQGQNRTADTRIFSPLLYQLSYLAEPMQEKNLAG